MKSQALVFTAVDKVEVLDIEVREPGPGEVLVQSAFSGMSPGTELRCLSGKQNGVSFPFVPGYSLSGTVVAVGEGVDLAEGTLVYANGTTQASVPLAWGGHVAHAVLPVGDVLPLPENVELLDAALVHMAAIAYHGVRLSDPRPHEKVAVIGLGLIGQLAARLHSVTGAKVVAADLSEERAALASKAGVEAFALKSMGDFKAYFPDGADVIVDATGVPAVLPDALSIARSLDWNDIPTPGARYVVQGSYVDTFCVPYEDAFAKEVSFILPRDSQPRDRKTILDLLSRNLLTVSDLITEVVSPTDAPPVYESLKSRSGDMMTGVVRWAE